MDAHVEIIKVTNPLDFWIAEKNHENFLQMMHDEIELEKQESEYDINPIVDQQCISKNLIIGIFDFESRKWLRARVLQEASAFSSNYLMCFLIDKGERAKFPKSNCRKLLKVQFQEIAPLAKRCSLYGIKPKDSNGSNVWAPLALQYFYDICQENSNDLYMRYKNTHNSTNYQEKNEVKLYFGKRVNFDSNNNTDSENIEWTCINDLMVQKKYAQYVKYGNDEYLCANKYGRYQHFDENNKSLAETRHELDNLESIKFYLKYQNQYTNEEVTKQPELTNNKEYIQLKPTLAQSILSRKQFYEEKKVREIKDPDIYVHGSSLLPYKSLANAPLQKPIRDYLNLNGILSLSRGDAFNWPNLFRGSHCCIIHDSETKSDSIGTTAERSGLTYTCPLVSNLLLFKMSELDTLNPPLEIINQIKRNYRFENGPMMIVICTSCEKAQYLIEQINEMIDMAARFNQKMRLKTLLLQGGGLEHQYDVVLANGVDILIAATPFCLVKALGSTRTNLERLKYLVFDNAYLLLDKYAKQIDALMAHYMNLLRINEWQAVVQFVAVSPFWSHKLKNFIEAYFRLPVIISDNKLEASFFGNVLHILMECDSNNQKVIKLLEILKMQQKIKNTIVFTKDAVKTVGICKLLSENGFLGVDLIYDQTKSSKIRSIVQKWDIGENSEIVNKGLILVCQQDMIDTLLIDSDESAISTADCIIHYDFPPSKTSFGKRLWFMRHHFGTVKETLFLANASNTNAESSTLVTDDAQRLCSYILFRPDSSNNEDFKYALGLYTYLSRIGLDEKYFSSKGFMKAVEHCKRRKEKEQEKSPLCPHLKAYGECMMQSTAASCKYRHKPNKNVDVVKWLDEQNGIKIPNEGYVRFKITFINDTNNLFVNILSYQSLKLEPETLYTQSVNLDSQLQLYFSNPNNVKYVSAFKDIEMYAYKDISTSIFKRIKILDVAKADGEMAYELVVKCIDYGTKLIIKTQDLIKLPKQFKQLPPQAVEVYLCDIRPIERDLNWSVTSKIFISEKLSKNKEFIGKIQLICGDILWLHPINSHKYFKALDLTIMDDIIRQELISLNYAVYYPKHMVSLREIFASNGLFVPKQHDPDVLLRQKCERLEETVGLKFDVAFAFLRSDCKNPDGERVYVSATESPTKFYVQIYAFYDLLESLNDDIRKFLEKMKNEEIKERQRFENATKQLANDDLDFEIDDDEYSPSEEYKNFTSRTQSFHTGLTPENIEWFNLHKNPIYCLAKLRKENEYYRAKVISYVKNTDEYKVFFVDFGDYDIVKIDDLRPIDEKFINILPFQAIECSLDAIKPLKKKVDEKKIVEEWTKESDTFLWELTHDIENQNIHLKLFAKIISDITENGSKIGKKYLIRLVKYNVPENVDIAHKLVTNKQARLTKAESLRIFGKNVENDGTENSNMGSQFIHYFIKTSRKSNQTEFLRMLETRIVKYQSMNESELIETDLIQCISKSLFFVNDETQLLSLVKILRRLILLPKMSNSENLKKIFVENNGLSSLFLIIEDKFSKYDKFKELVDSAFCFIEALIQESAYARGIIGDSERYLKALWSLMEKFNDKIPNVIDLIDSCCETSEADIFSTRFIDAIFKIKKNIKKNVNEECYNMLYELFRKFEKRHDLNVSNQLDMLQMEEGQDQAENSYYEKQNKLNRTHEYVLNTSQIIDNNENALALMDDGETEPKLGYSNNLSYSSNSSDQTDFDEKFSNDVMNLFQALQGQKQNLQNLVEPQSDLIRPNIKNDYQYPSTLWNQTKDSIILKVQLKNVKDSNLVYGTNTITFRCTLDKVVYGFDLSLFAEVDEKSGTGTPTNEYFLITIKKKHPEFWSRLLTSVIRPKFIKCEFDNIKMSNSDSSDDESEGNSEETKLRRREKREKKSNFSKALNDPSIGRTIQHLGKIHLEEDSSNSDSSSDFDFHPFDFKESDENYWK